MPTDLLQTRAQVAAEHEADPVYLHAVDAGLHVAFLHPLKVSFLSEGQWISVTDTEQGGVANPVTQKLHSNSSRLDIPPFPWRQVVYLDCSSHRTGLAAPSIEHLMRYTDEGRFTSKKQCKS